MIQAFVHRLFTVCTVVDPDLTIWRGQIENKKFKGDNFFYFLFLKKKRRKILGLPGPLPLNGSALGCAIERHSSTIDR
jgi:hypothetical protein